MANTTSSPPLSSRFNQLILLLASLGVMVVVYLLRRKPEAQAIEVSVTSPVVLNVIPSVDVPDTQVIQKKPPIKKWQQSLVMALTFVYGLVLIFLYNIDPQLSSNFIVVTVIAIIAFIVWKRFFALKPVLQIFGDLVTLPLRFYEAGQPAALTPSPVGLASYAVSTIFLVGVAAALYFFPTQPLLTLGIILASMALAAYAWVISLDVLIIERRFIDILRAVPAPDALVLPRASWWLLLAELSFIVVTTVFTTRPFYESPPTWQISGSESEWLTSTIYAAHTGLIEQGRIPRWDPYIAHGEPTIENPFNFIFNPFAGMPSLVLGPRQGLRLSVILCYFMAGLGGWFLGRMLGFGALPRVLLAMILMGKGNIHTMLNSSYYQLALSQLYMPWVIGGVIAVLRFPKRRWPIVLTALGMTLQLFNGNIWYVLPTAVGALITALVCVFLADKSRINWQAMRCYIVTGILAIGLSAIIALPVLLQFDRVGKHDPEVGSGWVAPLTDVIPLFFDPNRERTVTFYEPAFARESFHYINDVDEFYYSFITPAWYVVLILIVLPLYRPVSRRNRWIALVAVGLFALATIWGSGGMVWLYQNIGPLRQWRFVPRALAVASFWLALLIAMRTDHLWKNIQTADWAQLLGLKMDMRGAKVIPVILSAILIGGTLLAAAQVNDQWYQYQSIMREIDPGSDECTTWLRNQYPDAQLSVWQQDYSNITTFLNNRVRSWNISADFEMVPLAPTLGQEWLDLNLVVPAFGEFTNTNLRQWGRDNGYWIMPNSPKMIDGIPCLSRHTGPTLPYAYSISKDYFETLLRPQYDYRVDVSAFVPIHLVERRTDQVALIVTGKRLSPWVVGIQESAYPGWRVEVDGKPAHIESVGRQVGVIIPQGDQPVQVYFVYEPRLPTIGGMITVLTAVFCILFLLEPRRNWSRLLASVKKQPDDL